MERLNREQPRVLISAGLLSGGGPRTHLEFLLDALLRHEFSVVVAGTGCEWPQAVVERFAARGVQFAIPGRWMLRFPKLARLWICFQWGLRLRNRRFNSLYAIGGGRSNFFLARIIGRWVPSIYHEIVEVPHVGTLEAEAVRRFDFTVATSDLIARGIRHRFSGCRVVTVPFLMEPACAESSLVRSVDCPLRVVYVGRLVRHKRPQELVRTWPELRRRGALEQAELHVHGYESESGVRKEIDDLVTMAGRASGVFVHGPYEPSEIGTILRSADIVVLPSTMEGLPIVLIEAMFCGVPFVACGAGGVPDLAHGNPDVAVCGMEWSEFCAALCEMADRVRSGGIDHRRLIDWARSHFGREAVARMWISLLRNPHEFCESVVNREATMVGGP